MTMRPVPKITGDMMRRINAWVCRWRRLTIVQKQWAEQCAMRGQKVNLDSLVLTRAGDNKCATMGVGIVDQADG